MEIREEGLYRLPIGYDDTQACDTVLWDQVFKVPPVASFPSSTYYPFLHLDDDGILKVSLGTILNAKRKKSWRVLWSTENTGFLTESKKKIKSSERQMYVAVCFGQLMIIKGDPIIFTGLCHQFVQHSLKKKIHGVMV